jgi:hypothetical protein
VKNLIIGCLMSVLISSLFSCNNNHDTGIAKDDENNSLDTMTSRSDTIQKNDSLTPTEINSVKGTGASTNTGPGTNPKTSTGTDPLDSVSGTSQKSKRDSIPALRNKKKK